MANVPHETHRMNMPAFGIFAAVVLLIAGFILLRQVVGEGLSPTVNMPTRPPAEVQTTPTVTSPPAPSTAAPTTTPPARTVPPANAPAPAAPGSAPATPAR